MTKIHHFASRKRCAGIAFLAVSTVLLVIPANAAFVHPGTLSSKAELDFVRTMYLAGKQPWKSIVDSYKSSANLNFQPADLKVVSTAAGGSRDATTWYTNVQAAYLHAMLFAVTGDEAYAKVSVRIINKWASNMTVIEGFDAALDKGWAGPMVFAGEILKHVWKKWSSAEIAQFEMFLRERIDKGISLNRNNNWSATGIATKMAIGVFLDDKAIFDAAVERYKVFMPNYVGQDGLGYVRAEDYMHHARMGIGGTYLAAEIGWHQGLNLWESSGDQRMLLSAEKGVTRLDGHPHRSVTTDVKGQTPNWACWELAYNHFHRRLGKPMPEVQIFLPKLRPDKGMFGVPMLSPTHAEVGNGGSTTVLPHANRIAVNPAQLSVISGENLQSFRVNKDQVVLDLQGCRVKRTTDNSHRSCRLVIIGKATR